MSLNIRSVALYGLILFYGLTKEELKGRRPLSKFLSIKLIVMFTFYQSFVVSLFLFLPIQVPDVFAQFSALEGRVIHGTLKQHVLDLSRLLICSVYRHTVLDCDQYLRRP